MSLLSRKKQLVAAVEATKGTAETLDAGDNIFGLVDAKFTPPPTELEREILDSTLGTSASMPGPQICSLTFRVEVKGSGDNDAPPSWYTLMRGMGCKQTINSSVSVVLNPDSDDADSDTLTMAIYEDGVCHKMKGARGDGSIEFNANGITYFSGTFTGIYVSTTDTALLTITTPETTLPQIWNGAAFALNFGTSWTTARLSKLTLNLGNTVTIREDANATGGITYAQITKRDPGGTMNPDKVLVGTQNLWSFLMTPTTGTVTWKIGSGTGRVLTFAGPAFQITSMPDEQEDDISKLGMTFKLRKSSGDDEWTCTHT